MRKRIMLLTAIIVLATAGLLTAQEAVDKCWDPVGTAHFPRVRCNAGRVAMSAMKGELDDNAVAQCIAIPAAEVDYTVPVKDAFEICAHGNEAYVLCAAAAPVAATTVVGGYAFRVPEGACAGPYEMENAGVCSVIGTVALGVVCFRGVNY